MKLKAEHDKLGCPGCKLADKRQLKKGHGCCTSETYIKINVQTGECKSRVAE